MAEMRVEVDMSELDAAIKKAERLLAMLDEIECRFAALDANHLSSPIVASAPTSPPPPKPKR